MTKIKMFFFIRSVIFNETKHPKKYILSLLYNIINIVGIYTNFVLFNFVYNHTDTIMETNFILITLTIIFLIASIQLLSYFLFFNKIIQNKMNEVIIYTVSGYSKGSIILIFFIPYIFLMIFSFIFSMILIKILKFLIVYISIDVATPIIEYVNFSGGLLYLSYIFLLFLLINLIVIISNVSKTY
ncbi:hypothetical protein SAMN05421734_11335 [Pelagirhabdus alkalitolerans]|uniref:Uncharacterized protein n=1 Tax=Pelagirhabdus alkalitolerans TaxID=1612202 RepID=A0A1G6N0T7_9BACI|nr:hypothetical protein SAMN05421734_11335 [Pelagirhabdus alkalitolerans]